MKKKIILVLGAGRSVSELVHYLLQHAEAYGWRVIVADSDISHAEKLTGKSRYGAAKHLDVFDKKARSKLIRGSDLVISMLPAVYHWMAAESCLEFGKNLITASYEGTLVNPESSGTVAIKKELETFSIRAKKKGLLFATSMGLDPGIDHMSAAKTIHEIKGRGGQIVSFKSFTGGLMAPGSDDNPWQYKFTWSPMNVVLAGQGTARYIIGGKHKYVPYSRVFQNPETVEIPGYGYFEAYPNRDSLTYREAYGLAGIPTMLRGTLRRAGFCKAWNILVQLGMTDDTWKIENGGTITCRELVGSLLPAGEGSSLRKSVAGFAGLDVDSEELKKLEWLGLFEDQLIKADPPTPARALLALLEEKWKLNPDDKDMVVMQHRFVYRQGDKVVELVSSLAVTGYDDHNTAMAKTVGLPAAILAKLLLLDRINLKGVVIPVHREIYDPVLGELEKFGIRFSEQEGRPENPGFNTRKT